MPKYIPGSPEFVIQNMPGAGSLVAANYVYNVAKPDGLTLGMVQYNIYMDQLVGRKEVQFDMRRFNWIGSPVSETVVLYMRNDAPYKSIGDIVNAKEPPKCGSSGTAGELGRPVLATPGIPAERIKILRDAYVKAMKNPELLAEAQKGKMDVDLSPGEELEDLIKKGYGPAQRSNGPS